SPNTIPARITAPQPSTWTPERAHAATTSATTLTAVERTSLRPNSINRRSSSQRARLEQLLQLERGAHDARDLELARHVRRGRVLLAVHHPREGLLARGERAIGVLGALGHGYGAVVHAHRPGADTLDVEHERVAHPGRPGGVDLVGQPLEELLHCGHGPPLIERRSDPYSTER